MQLDDRQKKILGLVAVVVAAFLCIAGIVFFNSRRASPAPTEAPRSVVFDLTTTPQEFSTPMPTATAVMESEIWIFEGFTGETHPLNGVQYEYATFRNSGNGAILKAWCSGPNNPDPEIGAEYKWDKTTNILYPLIGTRVVRGVLLGIQTFWEPTYISK